MKIAFVGKGGSGKTTLSALFCRYLASLSVPVMAFDADINQHLGEALGLSEAQVAHIPVLGTEMERIKTYLCGSNPRISSASLMTKTTPPGKGSRLWSVCEANPLISYFGCPANGVTLLMTGPFSEQDLGLKCYHSKVGAVELLLNHCLDGRDEYLVVDMTAGADSFASGLFTKFDLTFLVVEPTRKSLSVYQQYTAYARDYGVKIVALGNKIDTEEDRAFIEAQIGDNVLTWIGRSAYIRAMEKGNMLPFSALEPLHLEALAMMKHAVDQCEQDWQRFYQQTVDFHRKNALSWLNTALGEDVTLQIDPDFSLQAYVYAHAYQFYKPT
ncbi:ATP-binding protein [Dictyobacter arantiisoli]|uniref:ATP-binding protein n=1 Tax=Dictyobacter arantiisoli TaxID=2014874 RepID=A0A5A5TF03_9CHLR|nr:ATP-binding protein [Dictyobacter arantiisoli]GCF09917.1 ATP-binding protein [Dictyobacter arantiisoli]